MFRRPAILQSLTDLKRRVLVNFDNRIPESSLTQLVACWIEYLSWVYTCACQYSTTTKKQNNQICLFCDVDVGVYATLIAEDIQNKMDGYRQLNVRQL